MTLEERIHSVQERIHAACARARRPADSVLLLAVTKTFPAEAILEAHAHGLREFGENYVQEFESKAPAARGLENARFHFIGRLQSNKTRKAAEIFDFIQTVDSGKIAGRLAGYGRVLEVMIEVKLSGEETKSGCAPAGLPALIEAVRAQPNLRLQGLMAMPPWTEDAGQSRPYFARLRELAFRHDLKGLSMGMSHDLEVAIEEGATIVRVGTALFGARQRG
jgi:pyridoxal phosphate enzyme (YggS family)